MVGGLIRSLLDPSEVTCAVYKKAHIVYFKVFKSHGIRKYNEDLNPCVSYLFAPLG